LKARLGLLFISTLLLIPASAFAASAPTPIQSHLSAGYQVTGAPGSITRIKGSFIVPNLDCSGGATTNVTISVMLDGFGATPDQMQAGIVASCSGGVASYRDFVAMLPNLGKVKQPTLTIKAGDVMEVQGKWSSATHGWHAQIMDVSSGVTLPASAGSPKKFSPALDSGAFIVSVSGSTPLANFGSVSMGQQYTGVKQSCILTSTGSHVITIGSLGAMAGYTLNQLTLVDGGGSTMASAGALTPDGSSFSVNWASSS